jgi:hypothetical protein
MFLLTVFVNKTYAFYFLQILSDTFLTLINLQQITLEVFREKHY